MAKKSRAQRQGAKRASRGKSRPRSYSQAQQGESLQQVDASTSQSVASTVAVAETTSRPESKPASKGKTPNIKRRSVKWQDEYVNVTDDLHMLMIVSIFLFIVIIGAGSFMV